MIKFSVPVLLVLLVLLQLQTEPVQGACCPNKKGVCKDGAAGTPCCGYRRCNIFCCSCQCREKNRTKREVGRNPTEERQHEEAKKQYENTVPMLSRLTTPVFSTDPFIEYDTNGDGKISIPEARWWLIACGRGNVNDLSSHFGELDSDNNGFLDRHEIGA